MASQPQDEEAIFQSARAIQDRETRCRFLEQACADDDALRVRVNGLLAEHEQLGSFLEASPAAVATVERPAAQRTGMRIGRYKLMEQIGEGGMGTVWVAEQTEPVKRRVALKLIKPGMDSRQVLSRFDAERQALALMDHPNIAKVFDGGMTDEGRPFFVMEYVKGMPITEYCDNVRLSIQQRLKLFAQVCQAVQHAHQKGIIHRDLKPSNILVCLYDGHPVPKLLDFGLAKAMHQPLTEHTLYTAHGLMVGTPLYMSPEQAELNNLDVDTRTDIYSLGVILYELLTGTTPLEKQQFKDAAFQEILRLIKEVEPQRPSLKISSSLSLPSIAAQRSLEPAQLSRAVRGDLDWIVMKALEKERSRRYETANGLARDIERYLENEPVQARPASTGYRLRKLIQRNKAAALATLLIAASLLLGTAISTWQAIRATAERNAKEAARKEAESHLHSLQQVAREWATSETLTGDPKRAEAAIRLAEAANVSKIWTEVLWAQAEIDQGQHDAVVRRLTPIVSHVPLDTADDGQVAAASLLAYAYFSNGNDRFYVKSMDSLRSIRQEIGPEAGLLKAGVEIYHRPQSAISTLAAATKKRAYPASLLMRANARSIAALHKRDASEISEAVNDLRYAELFAGNTPSVLLAKLRVHRHGYELARLIDDSFAAQGHLSELESCVQQIGTFPTSLMSTLYVAETHRMLNQNEKAFDIDKSVDWGEGFLVLHEVARLYESDDAQSILNKLNQLNMDESSPYGLIAKARLWAEIPARRHELLGAYHRIVTESRDSLVARWFALDLLALIGKPAELKEDAGKLLEEFGAREDYFGFVQSLEYLAGRRDEADSLKEAASSFASQCRIHYVIGLQRLATGDRRGARDHFARAVRTGVITVMVHSLARAYLARMDRDPNWPDWIEKKQ